MTLPKPKYIADPRIWNEFQVASRLNMGARSFKEKRPELEKQGFPKFDPLLGGWDSRAIELWLDARSGIALPANSDEALALAAVHKLHARAS